MANEITGRQMVCAFRQGAAWGTAVACGAGHGVLILADNIKPTINQELDDSAGQPFITDSDPGEKTTVGTVDAYLRYAGFDTLLACLMGQASAPAEVVGATGAYQHQLDFAAEIYGIFGTLAEQKLTNLIWEYPSVKVHGFKISGEMNKAVKISFDLICDQLERDSSINTDATMANVTAEKKNRLIMNASTHFLINDQDGAALDLVDEIKPSSFELTVTRPMSTDAVSGQGGVAEPDDDGFPTVSLMLKFPRYNTANNAFFDNWEAGTPKKMEIQFTGKICAASQPFEMKFILPHLRVAEPEAPVSGAGKIPFTMNLEGLGADSAPAGMTGLTAPLRLEFINLNSTAPLT